MKFLNIKYITKWIINILLKSLFMEAVKFLVLFYIFLLKLVTFEVLNEDNFYLAINK